MGRFSRLFLAAVLAVLCFVRCDARAGEDIIDATVRVYSDGAPRGTGVVCDVSGGVIHLFTCAHVAYQQPNLTAEFWRDGHPAKRTAPVRIDFCSPPKNPQALSPDWEWDFDVSYLAADAGMFGGQVPPAIPLAPADFALQRGQTIYSVGCANGAWPTLFRGHATSVHSYGFAFSPGPAGGRSGSGVFVMLPMPEGVSPRLVGIVFARIVSGPSEGLATSSRAIQEHWASGQRPRSGMSRRTELTRTDVDRRELLAALAQVDRGTVRRWGLGVLVHKDAKRGIVIAPAGGLTGGTCGVALCAGERSQGRILAHDRTWGLVAIEIDRPKVKPVKIAPQWPRPSEEVLWIDSRGRTLEARVRGYTSPDNSPHYELLAVQLVGGEPQSSGALFNKAGELTGLVTRVNRDNCIVSVYCKRLRRFAEEAIQRTSTIESGPRIELLEEIRFQRTGADSMPEVVSKEALGWMDRGFAFGSYPSAGGWYPGGCPPGGCPPGRYPGSGYSPGSGMFDVPPPWRGPAPEFGSRADDELRQRQLARELERFRDMLRDMQDSTARPSRGEDMLGRIQEEIDRIREARSGGGSWWSVQNNVWSIVGIVAAILVGVFLPGGTVLWKIGQRVIPWAVTGVLKIIAGRIADPEETETNKAVDYVATRVQNGGK